MNNHVKKVLYVTSRFPALSMTFVANEMTQIQSLGPEVHVATLWKPMDNHTGHPVEIPFLDRVFATNLTVKNMFVALYVMVTKPAVILSILKLLPGHLKSPWLLLKLFAAIPKGLQVGIYAKKNSFDMIHAHFLTTPTTVALLASKYSGIPYTCTAHAFDITSTNPRITNGSVAYKCIQAKEAITISNFNKTDILTRWPQIPGTKVKVIYNGIDTDNYYPGKPIETEASQPTRVVCISNLNEKKGHAILIDAVHLTINDGYEIHLDLYGSGPLQNELKNQIQALSIDNQVSLHGAVNQSQTVSILQETDIFALASIPLTSGDADGLPTVLIESLSCCVPTVSTQVTGIPEIIIDGKTGLCVPPNDARAFADAIIHMIENPDRAEQMAKYGRVLVLDKFDGRNSAKQLMKYWNTPNSKAS